MQEPRSDPARQRGDIEALIVSYNSSQHLPGLLSDLARDDVHVLLHDNASQDASARVAQNFSCVIHVEASAENLGFSRALNRLLQRSTSPYLLVINPDVRLPEGALAQLVRELEEFPATGIAAPVVRHSEGRHRVISAGYAPDLFRVFAHYYGLSRFSKSVPCLRGQYLFEKDSRRDRQVVDWATGACLLLRRELLSEVGMFSEQWFMYAEDIEYCIRTSDRGWQTVLVGGAEVFHEVGASAPTDGRPSTLWLLNLYDFYCSHLSSNRAARVAWGLVVALALGTRGLVRRAIGRPAQRQLDAAALDLLRATVARRGRRDPA